MTIPPGFLSRRTWSGFSVALRSAVPGDLEIVSSAEVLAFRSKSGKAFAIFSGRTVQTLRPFSRLQLFLRKQGGWFPIGRGLVVNFNRLVRSKRAPGGGYLVTLEDGTDFNLLPGYLNPILKFLGTENLLQISPMSRAHAFMMKLGLKDLAKQVTDMSKEELIRHFSPAGGGAVLISDLIVNFLWQVLQYIRAGNESPVDGGNVRSLWYMVAPAIKKLGTVGNTDHYKTLSDQMARMVKGGVCSYREFNFYDDGKWALGAYNPHVILMAEKEAHFGMFLKKMQDLTGVTVIATGGQPSGITSEYFCEALRKKIEATPNFPPLVVLALVDYDPFGWVLQGTFMADLKTFGVKVIAPVIFLTLPKHFTPDEIAQHSIDLVKAGKTPPGMPRKWMKLTDGIDGQPWADGGRPSSDPAARGGQGSFPVRGQPVPGRPLPRPEAFLGGRRTPTAGTLQLGEPGLRPLSTRPRSEAGPERLTSYFPSRFRGTRFDAPRITTSASRHWNRTARPAVSQSPISSVAPFSESASMS